MMEFKEILVAIDFSEEANKAIEPAFSLAKLIRGKVFLFHVLDLLPKPNPLYAHYAPRESVMKGEIDKMEVKARTKLMDLLPESEEYRDVDTEIVVVRHSSAHEAIVEEAVKLGVDVIVLTHKGWSTLAQVLIGSTAEQVVRHARCPVMMIKG